MRPATALLPLARLVPSCRKGAIDHRRRVLRHSRNDVAVQVQRGPDLAMPQAFAGDPGMNPVGVKILLVEDPVQTARIRARAKPRGHRSRRELALTRCVVDRRFLYRCLRIMEPGARGDIGCDQIDQAAATSVTIGTTSNAHGACLAASIAISPYQRR
jgi:hypothetical protein